MGNEVVRELVLDNTLVADLLQLHDDLEHVLGEDAVVTVTLQLTLDQHQKFQEWQLTRLERELRELQGQ